MPKVDFTQDNIARCLCGECPVQAKSKCARDLYEKSIKMEGLPKPEQVPGLYCASGKATCTDLDIVQFCKCPGCLVWSDYNLKSNHYCYRGSAETSG
ncbi:MAG: DUF2769 domain-containing protein [Bacteriovoracaceae bacterium]|jgi:hypothetical protein|nr:DUF2769 domain-containing protein [Bacteriovoracaceae bacterium]HOD69760.1 DUF2769 domain-containing protein [Deltaproteobacteria bacterium]HRR22019.1 DUF2769 domain-containing protein [Desulfomonilia bacterium]HOS25976.1 DUF2769 domain-containing protein [Deltaproteobacteria bacterium]HQO81948.1 DUF2769 domain-containing protein [Deltaproteobacteria bacterium]